MAIFNISLPFQYFADPNKGRPVFNAYIFIGEVDKDPELFPIQAYQVGENGSLTPVLQPLRTGSGGVIMVNGSPAQIVTQQNYSMRVRDSNLEQVYYVANGLGGEGDEETGFVPLAGTEPGLPITGQLEYAQVGSSRNWNMGVIGGGFDGLWLVDLQQVESAQFGISVNNQYFVFSGNGELNLATDYASPTLNLSAAATCQYVQDQVGSPTAAFLPLAGTNPTTGPVTGPIEFDDGVVTGTLGILTGLTDIMTLYSDDSILIASGASSTSQWWAFGTDGSLSMPDIDYSAVSSLSAVNKAYVDAQAGGGGAFIPLSGTTTGNEVTGLIKFEDAALSKEWQIGISNVPGLWQDMTISNTAGGTLPTSFGIIVNGNYNIFDSDGLFTTNDVKVLGAIDIDGTTTMQGLFAGQVLATNVAITAAQGTSPGNLTRYDYVNTKAPISTTVTTNTTQTITGLKTLPAGTKVGTSSAVAGGAVLSLGGTISFAGAPPTQASAGNLVLNALGVLSIESSDMRLKEFVEPMPYGLDTIRTIETIAYDWVSNGQHDVGFSAQQLSEVLPESVHYNEVEDTYALRTTPIIAALVAAVQELSSRLEEIHPTLN